MKRIPFSKDTCLSLVQDILFIYSIDINIDTDKVLMYMMGLAKKMYMRGFFA